MFDGWLLQAGHSSVGQMMGTDISESKIFEETAKDIVLFLSKNTGKYYLPVLFEIIVKYVLINKFTS